MIKKIDDNKHLERIYNYVHRFFIQRGCEKRIVPKKKKDQEFIMNSRSFFLL